MDSLFMYISVLYNVYIRYMSDIGMLGKMFFSEDIPNNDTGNSNWDLLRTDKASADKFTSSIKTFGH